MNHNKYPNSCKNLAQKWYEQSLKYKYYSSNEVGPHAPNMQSRMCTQNILQLHHSLSAILCPKVWVCIGYRWTKEKHFQNFVLVVKAFIWGTLKKIKIVKDQSKWLIEQPKKKKKKDFERRLTLGCAHNQLIWIANGYNH
jgi:hypothetical protein